MFKEDPARAGPEGSNSEEIGGGRGIQRGGGEINVSRVPHCESFGYGTLRHLLNKCTIMWIFSGVVK